MADLGGVFNANDVKPSSFDVVPASEYEAIIVNSEMKTTSKGDGKYLNLELQILNGPCQNRKIFDKLNLINPNPQAVEIARGTLSAICRAVGVMTPRDSSELHNKPLRIKVVVKKSDEFGEQNAIKAYKPRAIVGTTIVPVTPAAPAPEAVGAVANTAAPWA